MSDRPKILIISKVFSIDESSEHLLVEPNLEKALTLIGKTQFMVVVMDIEDEEEQEKIKTACLLHQVRPRVLLLPVLDRATLSEELKHLF